MKEFVQEGTCYHRTYLFLLSSVIQSITVFSVYIKVLCMRALLCSKSMGGISSDKAITEYYSKYYTLLLCPDLYITAFYTEFDTCPRYNLLHFLTHFVFITKKLKHQAWQ